jgi:hypothetical protein
MPLARCVALVCAVCLQAAGLVARPQIAGGDPTSAEAVVEAAARYLKQYQQELTAVLADERYRQQIINQAPRVDTMPRVRTLESEVFFMFVPGADWMAIRDVVTQNGRALKDRPNLQEALKTLPTAVVASTFKEYNSRFNIGRIIRNFNEPTLSLLLLDDRYRSNLTIERKKVSRDGSDVWVTLAVTEASDEDTLIHSLAQRPIRSRGEYEVEARTGRIRKAQLTATFDSVVVELTTDFALDPRLDILVPTRFVEYYSSKPSNAAVGDPRSSTEQHIEEIRCDSTYTNYRRFEVKVIIR